MELVSKNDLDDIAQARLQALQESFVLVLSADYQMTKLIPFLGGNCSACNFLLLEKSLARLTGDS